MSDRPRHFLLRLVRGGPLVPARLQLVDYEPGEPGNSRDRWPPVIEVVDIAGEDRPPEELTERFYVRPGHWKFAQPISAADYRRRFDAMRWVERNQPDDPVLSPRRQIDLSRVAMPNFERENAR